MWCRAKCGQRGVVWGEREEMMEVGADNNSGRDVVSRLSVCLQLGRFE